MSVNTLTSYLLLLVRKPTEALEFIKITERIALRLLEHTQKAQHNLHNQSSKALPTIGESEQSSVYTNQKPPGTMDSTANDQNSFFVAGATGNKDSHITGMLLTNYLLSINLMSSIAQKFSNPDGFETNHQL